MTRKQKIDANKKIAVLLRVRWLVLASVVILLMVVVTAIVFLGYTIRHEHDERGQFNVSDTFIGSNPAHSLDLKLAAKASYPSAPLSIRQDLGLVNGLHEQIFKYPVKVDNLIEYGLMVTPTTPKPPQGYPVIILLHGFERAARYKTTIDYLSDMDFYANHGFLVVKPDLRGQGLSIDSGFANSAYYSMDYNTDVLSLVTALRQTSYVNKANINLWGHSMGGYLALRAAVLSSYIKNTIILAGPVDSITEMYLSYIPPSDENNPYALATRNDVFSKYGTPADNPAFWRDASPINFVSHIKGTIQLHAGTLDDLIPLRFSADLNNSLQRTKVKHQYFVYPDGSHNLSAQRPLIYQRSLDILKP